MTWVLESLALMGPDAGIIIAAGTFAGVATSALVMLWGSRG